MFISELPKAQIPQGAGLSFFWIDSLESMGTGRDVAHILNYKAWRGHSVLALGAESGKTKRVYKR